MPDFGVNAATGIGKGKFPEWAIARLAQFRAANGEDARNPGVGNNIFDEDAFFHIFFALCLWLKNPIFRGDCQ